MTQNDREKEVEQHLTRLVKRAGWITWKLAPTEVGMPDRIVIAPGGNVWMVELKRGRGGVVSPRQEYVHRQVRALGVPVYVLAGKEAVGVWVQQRREAIER